MEPGKAGDPDSPHEARHGGAGPRQEADAAKGIEEILSSLRSAEAAGEGAQPLGKGPAAASKGGGVEGQAPGAASADRGGGGQPQGGGATDELKEFLMRRIEALEKGLAAERERASAAESRSVRQEANRGEVEEQLRSISDLLKRERDESHSRGRIESLEARLDKMHETWAAALERPASRRETEAGDPDNPNDRRQGGEELAQVRERLDKLAMVLDDFMKRSGTRSAGAAGAVAGRLEALEKRLAGLPASLAAAVDKAASRQEASAKAVAGELAYMREWVQKLATIFTESTDATARELCRLRAEVTAALRQETAERGVELEKTRASLGVVVRRLYELEAAAQTAERRLAERLDASLGPLSARIADILSREDAAAERLAAALAAAAAALRGRGGGQ